MSQEEMIESLVSKITAEILSQFSEALGKPKETVMVFGKSDDAYPSCVGRILKSGVRVLYLDTDWQASRVDRYILPFLDLNQMGDLSRGMARGRIAGMVLNTVLKGHVVEVAAYGYEHYLETAPEALIKLYQGQRETLIDFGIRPLEDKRESLRMTDKSLITEKDVRQALEKRIGSLRVMKGACVTPLAADLARENKIKILNH